MCDPGRIPKRTADEVTRDVLAGLLTFADAERLLDALAREDDPGA